MIETQRQSTIRLLLAAMVIAGLTAGQAATEPLHSEAPAQRAEGMVLIPGGAFEMGSEAGYDDEKPLHSVQLDAFYLGEHEVTNAQFGRFVEATGYVTEAERSGYCWAFVRGADDFAKVDGADWRHPQGPGSSIDGRPDHPVVCVSWHDAAAYAQWAGKRLPTEAEWEYAARAGERVHFVAAAAGNVPHGGHGSAGTEQSPSAKAHATSAGHNGVAADDDGRLLTEANVWQGTWPEMNREEDGRYYTSSVGSFAANAFGVYDMIGNVWEWTADWYAADYYARSPKANPQGAESGTTRVARGGSWFCSPNYCGAYSTNFRGASPPDRGFNNVGFRVAMDG